MPEPSEPTKRSDTSGVPPYPPGDKDRGVSREANEEIGYGPPNEETNATLHRIRDEEEARLTGRPLRDPAAQAAQQAINERGAQAAWLNTPDGKTFSNLIAKQEAGGALSSDEIAALARIRAKRENRHNI